MPDKLSAPKSLHRHTLRFKIMECFIVRPSHGIWQCVYQAYKASSYRMDNPSSPTFSLRAGFPRASQDCFLSKFYIHKSCIHNSWFSCVCFFHGTLAHITKWTSLGRGCKGVWQPAFLQVHTLTLSGAFPNIWKYLHIWYKHVLANVSSSCAIPLKNLF